MKFEWDPEKSKKNLQKHGVTFQESIEIWQGIYLEIDEIAKTKDGEKRGATIGLIKGEVYTAIWTLRGKILRLISVRRSRDGEKEIFWKEII
jgi:uncharacterized DUF497 family protein